MWWFIAALGALAYAAGAPKRPGGYPVCVMTTAKDDPSDQCIVSCHRDAADARRSIDKYWADKKSLRTSIVPERKGQRWC